MAISELEPSPNPFDGNFDEVADNFLSVGLPRLREEINATEEHMEEMEAAAVTAAAAAAGAVATVAAAATAAANSANLADTRTTAAQAAKAAAETARDLAQTYGAALSGTSTSNLLIEKVSKVFVTQAGKAWNVGQRLRAASADATKIMEGEITAYAGTSLTILVDYSKGTGNHAAWNIGIAGALGGEGPPGTGTGTVASVNGHSPDVAGAVTIPDATSSAPGLQSATDKAKLDGIAAAATANDTDANLRARANHTGTQAIATVSGLQTALDSKIASTEKGAANGVAPLDAGSKIAAVYLPSFVDDVLEYANLAAFPGTGEGGKIYVPIDTNKTYRWGGSAYVEISPSPGSTDAVTEGAGNLYFTMQRVRDAVLTGLSLASAAAVTAVDTVVVAIGKLQKQVTDNLATLVAHIANTGNPHGTTKAQVGLGSVDNTADSAKPVSTAQQAALDAKAPINNAVFTGTTTLAQDPASALQAATKQYVDALLANVGKRTRVRAATTGNITISTALNSGDVIDGVTLANGDWVLVKDQTTANQNGVYAVAASPARVAEYDTYDEHAGSLIAVQEGTVNADMLWLCVANQGGTLNTTGIAFTRMVTAGELLAANNLSDLANAATARTNLGAQATLISATNIKTISGQSLLGAGDLAVGGGFTNMVPLAFSGTLTVPTGVTKGKMTLQAPGGGGGGQSSASGGGAIVAWVTLVPGDVITVVLGAPGSGSAFFTGSDGGVCSVTFMNGYLEALGGQRGDASSTVARPGGTASYSGTAIYSYLPIPGGGGNTTAHQAGGGRVAQVPGGDAYLGNSGTSGGGGFGYGGSAGATETGGPAVFFLEY